MSRSRSPRNLPPEDLILWQHHVRDVVRQDYASHTSLPSRKKIEIQERTTVPRPVLSSQHTTMTPSFTPNRRQLRHLRPHRTLDLHGYTLSQAWEALERLLSSHPYTSEPILLITGKGSTSDENTLAKQVPRWLQEPSFARFVKGFHRALPHHGGGGALYVFLRKKI